jgi:hypothetical protein
MLEVWILNKCTQFFSNFEKKIAISSPNQEDSIVVGTKCSMFLQFSNKH